MLVFVYGTLTDPDRVDDILDDWSFAGEAVLDGLVRADGQYPTLVPPVATAATAADRPGPHVEGRLLQTPDVDALDAYEGVDPGLYVRVSVPAEDRESEAAVYVGDPARLDADGAWPGSGSFPDRVRRYVDGHDVVVRPTCER